MFSKKANQTSYPFILPELEYDINSFGDLLSKESFDYHHGKHHKAYVTKLNEFAKASPELQSKSLEEIISLSEGPIFNNAAQVWNHSFFWHCLSSKKQEIQKNTQNLINDSFGSTENFKNEFKKAALGQFGSGWVWVILKDNKLEIIKTANADTPITKLSTPPVLCCDVWEHAYYIDYRNDRGAWIESFLNNFVNWGFVEENINNIL